MLEKGKQRRKKDFPSMWHCIGKMLKIGEEGKFNLNLSKPELGQKNKTWPKTQRTGRYSVSPKYLLLGNIKIQRQNLDQTVVNTSLSININKTYKINKF